MLFNRGLWAPGLARMLDTSLRYTVDKTSREVLFLPLPTELKYRAKPFVDVTMDRLAKGMGARPDPGADQGLGPGLGLAATELRQFDDGRVVDADGAWRRGASTCDRSGAVSSSR